MVYQQAKIATFWIWNVAFEQMYQISQENIVSRL